MVKLAGEHRDSPGQRELDRLLLGGCQVLTGPAAQPAQCLVPVHAFEGRQPVRSGVKQV
jgi:hypothetical protein